MNFAIDVICLEPSTGLLAHLRYEDDAGKVDDSICGMLSVHIVSDEAIRATLFFVDESPLSDDDLALETIASLNNVVKQMTDRYVSEWSIYVGAIAASPSEATPPLPTSVSLVRDAWSAHSMRVFVMESDANSGQDQPLGVFDVFYGDRQPAPILTGILLDARLSTPPLRSKLCHFVLKTLGKPGLDEGALLAGCSLGYSWGSVSTRSE